MAGVIRFGDHATRVNMGTALTSWFVIGLGSRV